MVFFKNSSFALVHALSHNIADVELANYYNTSIVIIILLVTLKILSLERSKENLKINRNFQFIHVYSLSDQALFINILIAPVSLLIVCALVQKWIAALTIISCRLFERSTRNEYRASTWIINEESEQTEKKKSLNGTGRPVPIYFIN